MKKGFNQLFEATPLFWSFLPWILLSTISGLIAGASTVALLNIINDVLHHPTGLTKNILLIFTALSILVLIGRMVSNMSTNWAGQHFVGINR